MKYQLTGESYVIEGRGRVYLAVLEEDVPSDELSAAVGTSVAMTESAPSSVWSAMPYTPNAKAGL